MNKGFRLALGILGLMLVAGSPYLWFVKPELLWITCPLILIWAFWLMIEYLRWAKTLGKK
jgi:hypothetical protein